MVRITRRGLAGFGLAAPFIARQGLAQSSYPDRPVRMIVPYSAGGVADTIARIIQPKVAEHLGQSFIIENRTGASGSIGAMAVAQSPADGHTILFEGATFATLPTGPRALPPREIAEQFESLSQQPLNIDAARARRAVLHTSPRGAAGRASRRADPASQPRGVHRAPAAFPRPRPTAGRLQLRGARRGSRPVQPDQQLPR